jgi:hypothetical protein
MTHDYKTLARKSGGAKNAIVAVAPAHVLAG